MNPTNPNTRQSDLETIINIEKGLWYSVREQDDSLMEKHLAPTYKFFSFLGRGDRSKTLEIDIHFSKDLQLDAVRFDNWRYNWVRDDVLVLHYTSKAWLVISQKPIIQQVGCMVVWAKTDGFWQMQSRSEWPIADEDYKEDTE